MRSGGAALWRARGKQRQLNGSFIFSSFAEQHCSAPLCPRRCEAVDSREGLALTSLSPSGVSPHATTPAPKLPALYLAALAAARQWTHERAWHSPASRLPRTWIRLVTHSLYSPLHAAAFPPSVILPFKSTPPRPPRAH